MDSIIKQVASYINNSDEKIVIGISGHGASGKTTFAKHLRGLIDQHEVNYMNTDPYIIGSELRKYATIDYEFDHEQHTSKMTACHPAAHHVVSLERDLNMIRAGLDFNTIKTHYMESTLIKANHKVSIVEGMSTAFVDPDLFDLKIYLYTDGDTEFTRRGIRDVSERGMNIDYLKQSHKQRRIQYELFMHAYHEAFDLVIKNTDKTYFLEKDSLDLC
ncbi:phosphoribulokinase [Bacillaceae bacterium JMAK1]|nr:phosphoribulokinase [Bacillaceae bacterium JMAK1]